MDELSITDERLERALRELTIVNRWLGGYRASAYTFGQTFRHSAQSTLRVLDVGCGIGDYALEIKRLATRRGVNVVATGVDLNPHTLRLAEEYAFSHGASTISFQVGDALELPFDDGAFDIAHAALLLHHFEDDDAVTVIREMARVSGGRVVINDLHRHPIPYAFVKLLGMGRLFGEMFTHDAPVSVLRGFRRTELEHLFERAGLSASITWRPAFRWIASTLDERP